MNLWRGWPLPDRHHQSLWLLKHLLAVAILAVIYHHYGVVIGRDAGIGLFILLLGLKIIEMRSRREFMLTVCLGFFLLVTVFFYSQNLSVALAAIVCTSLLLGSLVALTATSAPLSTLAHLRIAGTLILHSIPPMLVAFVLFPRPASPLWQLPKDAHTASSGLSDEMSPGQLSELTLSDAVAFRVAFTTNSPPPAEMYWRGPVLVDTDGRKWTPGQPTNDPVPALVAEGTRYSYSVTMEPTDKPWLYVLEHPSKLPDNAHLERDLRVTTMRPVSERIRYSAESYTHVAAVEANWEELRAARQLPANMHPRAVALGQKWRRELLSDDAIVQQALKLFREHAFYYTVSPPEIAGDSVDGFLFDTRRGFCEHYAAAFTVLMRSAKIPARIVTGYQGGEYNPVGDYYIVRQRDAHAWAEVWLGQRGWVRIDPTGAVAPERVQRGINQAFSRRTFNNAADDLALQGMAAILSRARFVYDTLNNRWNLWVISYNARRQAELLESFGFNFSRRALAMVTVLGLLASFVAIATLALRAAQSKIDPVRKAYETFCRKLARRGVVKESNEGPMDFSQRVSRAFPALGATIVRITELYVQLRYAPAAPPGARLEFMQAIRRFDP
jgi:transglutaminase-like putative cysteine protease